MICPGRINSHRAKERVIQIRRLEPRNVGRDLEQMFENRQRAADQHRGNNAVADRERALQSDDSPIIVRRRIEIDDDQSEAERAEPYRESDAGPRANQFATIANLKREINGGESANQADDKKRGVDFSEEHAAPEADEKSGVKPVISPKQNAEDERRECVRREQPAHFWRE